MKPITIGTILATGEPLTLDLEKLVHLLIQASSGGGKSNAVRVILEETYGVCPHYILDDEGEYVTMRDHGDYVLVANQNGDLKGDIRAADLLVRRAVEANFNVVVDLSEMGHKDRHAYVKVANESFTGLPRDLWGPRILVLDEAHKFAPESGKQKDSSIAKDAVIETASRGRKRDHKAVIATQRIAKLSKDVAAECQNKLIGLANLADDRTRSVEELGVGGAERSDVKASLGRMAPGEFYAIGPAFGLTEVTKVRIKLAKTQPPPKGKAARRAPAPRVNIDRILKQLGDLPQQAQAEATSLAEAKARIAELKKELGSHSLTPVKELVEKVVEVSALTQQDRNLLLDIVEVGRAQADIHKARWEHVTRICSEVERTLAKGCSKCHARPAGPNGKCGPCSGYVEVNTRLPPKAASAPVHTTSSVHVQIIAEGVSAPQQRILDNLAWLESIGIKQADKTQLALLADASPTSSSYANNLGRLRSAGAIDYPSGGVVALSQEGRKLANKPERPPTVADLHATLQRQLAAPQWRILQALIREHPTALEKTYLAELVQASPTSSSFANNLGSLRSLGFITYPERGMVAAASVLFLEA